MSARIKELTTENGTVYVHPVKTVKATPTVDCAGRPMPTELDQCYGRYSTAKAAALEHCKSLCRDLNGRNLCIMSHNCMAFTVSFDYPDPETGELYRCIVTKDNTDAYRIA